MTTTVAASIWRPTLAEAVRRALNRDCPVDVLGKWAPRLRAKRGQSHVVEWPGLVADAAALGVSRFHLYRVLRGQRVSRRLVSAYRELKARFA
jgi:hypothetical protein